MLADVRTGLSVTMTEGFNSEVAAELVEAWSGVVPTGEVQVYERKALDVLPQYLQFIGSASVWTLLAPAAAAFLGRIGYLLADEVISYTRGKLQSPKAIDTLATALCSAQKKLPSACKVLVAINLPDERWGTALELDATDEAALAKQLAIYALNIETIAERVNEFCQRGEGPLGQGKIVIREDGQIDISWLSQRDFKRIQLVISQKR